MIKNIEKLEIGNRLIIKVDENLLNLLQLQKIKAQSYKNLLNSYASKTCDKYETFDLNLCLNKFAILNTENTNLRYYILQNALDKDYSYIDNRFCFSYYFDYYASSIVIVILKLKGEK